MRITIRMAFKHMIDGHTCCPYVSRIVINEAVFCGIEIGPAAAANDFSHCLSSSFRSDCSVRTVCVHKRIRMENSTSHMMKFVGCGLKNALPGPGLAIGKTNLAV